MILPYATVVAVASIEMAVVVFVDYVAVIIIIHVVIGYAAIEYDCYDSIVFIVLSSLLLM